ncbi:C6 zinc finger protein [Phlyctema vagabunda]|uniref:C6 zinc finger protein n=1 Tax=Phlyctema vagabunda TaxID=108571 RepID=A0ABR4PAV4_9HELO
MSAKGNSRVAPVSGPKKGHTKSRRGCYNCKRRRIKCHENHPICHACASRGFVCEWPDIQIRQIGSDQRCIIPKNPVISPFAERPQIDRYRFDMQDFRLFHHFVESAYPHEPPNNQSAWTHEIPIIASNVSSFPPMMMNAARLTCFQHDYLMHAMLALAASDMISPPSAAVMQPKPLKFSAISHRVKAISSLNRALSCDSLSFEEGNAMLGTCYALVFQSVLMDDGLPEYMTFIRGIVLVSIQLKIRNLNFMFGNMLGDESLSAMEPQLQSAPTIDPESVRAACESLNKFLPLCQTDSDKLFHSLLLETTKGLLFSSREGYMGLRKVYECFSYTMSHEDFQWLLNPANLSGKLLQAHFIAIQLTMNPVTRKPDPRNPSTENWSVRWMDPVCRDVPPGQWKYFEWPLAVAERVKEELRIRTHDVEVIRDS